MGQFNPFAKSGSGGGEGGSGREIVSVTFLSSDKGDKAGIPGAKDTYKILYSDRTYNVFTVYNGDNGITPLLRQQNNIIEVSYDEGETWEYLYSLSQNEEIRKYNADENYNPGQLVYLQTGQLYQATKDFQPSTEYPTIQENFSADIEKGNLISIARPIPTSYIDDLFN